MRGVDHVDRAKPVTELNLKSFQEAVGGLGNFVGNERV